MSANPVRVAVTGAAGQIGYSLVFRIASGARLGPDPPVILQMLEIPPAMDALDGVAMELDDCAFPLLTDMVLSDDPDTAFEGTDVALLVGSRPRTAGMERQDLLEATGASVRRVARDPRESGVRKGARGRRGGAVRKGASALSKERAEAAAEVVAARAAKAAEEKALVAAQEVRRVWLT